MLEELPLITCCVFLLLMHLDASESLVFMFKVEVLMLPALDLEVRTDWFIVYVRFDFYNS